MAKLTKDNIVETVQSIMNKTGSLLTRNYLRKNKLNNLEYAIYKELW